MKTDKIELYNLKWNATVQPIAIEMYMIQHGGRWRKKNGEWAGEGLFHHFKQLQTLLWPTEKWHPWRELLLKSYCENGIIGVMAPAATGKTYSAALFALSMYYCFSSSITILVSSTELKMLRLRVWGEIIRHHKLAKQRFDWLPGQVSESAMMIVTDKRFESEDGRDFRNGIVGIPCKRGGTYVGLGSYIGIHNKIVMLIGDECQLMPAVYVDAISNLSKCPKFICIAMGNPIGIDNGLGKVCEPSSIVGGWDGGIDQTGGTKTWPTRFKDGICVQLVGTDSPNFSVPRGTPYPFPTLLKPEDIEKDVAFYGTDSWNYLAMDEGRMPRGIGVRRVITRQLCLKNGAMEEPLWRTEERTRIGALDAAYSATGGDRSVFVEVDFGAGFDLDGKDVQLIFIRDIVVVPVTNDEDETPEDQIANRVMEECIQRGITPENFFFDSTGKGTLMASFARLWSNMVNPVEFGGKASERQVSNEINQISREYYFNFVSELWYSMRYVIEAKQLRGMTEEALSEFIGREWGYQNRRIQVEPKEKMKLKLGRSPDIADSIVTALEGARRRGFVISKLSKQRVYNADDGQWKRDLEDLEVKLHHECDLNYAV